MLQKFSEKIQTIITSYKNHYSFKLYLNKVPTAKMQRNFHLIIKLIIYVRH